MSWNYNTISSVYHTWTPTQTLQKNQTPNFEQVLNKKTEPIFMNR